MLEGDRAGGAAVGALNDRAAAVVAGARRALGWTDWRLQRLRESLTPGQRWTAGIALVLAVMVLRFGAPTVTRTLVDPATQAAPPAAAAERPDRPGNEQIAAAQAPRPASRDVGASGAPAPASTTEVQDHGDPGGEAETRGFPEIAAFVAVDDETLPGRDDRAMAEAFLVDARFGAAVVEYDPEAEEWNDLCDEQADTDLVIAGVGLPVTLRDCLLQGSTHVLAYDERARPGLDDLSTRRSVAEVLADLARWGTDDGALSGTVGLAASDDLRGQVALARSAMRQAGIDPVIHYVTDAGTVADGVQKFAAAGVDTTVFALEVARQREWVTLDRVVNRDVDYVVADAADAIVEGGHSPAFDGAVAYTSLLFPWHDETPEQEECRTRWEDAGGTAAGTVELYRAFTWCQHVTLVDEAIERVRDEGATLSDALATVELVSPLTTELGPLDNESGWGPRLDHVVTWRATCACWGEPDPVTDRSP